jgi:hypothetical protein
VLKQHKPRFDEVCSKLLDRRKQTKLQWLQNPSQTNEGNLNSVRRETSRTFRKKKREYLKEKVVVVINAQALGRIPFAFQHPSIISQLMEYCQCLKLCILEGDLDSL